MFVFRSFFFLFSLILPFQEVLLPFLLRFFCHITHTLKSSDNLGNIYLHRLQNYTLVYKRLVVKGVSLSFVPYWEQPRMNLFRISLHYLRYKKTGHHLRQENNATSLYLCHICGLLEPC